MNTLLNILLGFLIFIFVSVSIVLMSGWIVMQVMHSETNKDDCGCNEETPKINDFSKETKVSGMGGVGGPIDTIRGKDIEPREENDPNPNQK